MLIEELSPNKIKELRRKKKLTQDEFAEQLGVTKGYICSIEAGKKKPSRSLIIAISSFESLCHIFCRCNYAYFRKRHRHYESLVGRSGR